MVKGSPDGRLIFKHHFNPPVREDFETKQESNKKRREIQEPEDPSQNKHKGDSGTMMTDLRRLLAMLQKLTGPNLDQKGVAQKALEEMSPQ